MEGTDRWGGEDYGGDAGDKERRGKENDLERGKALKETRRQQGKMGTSMKEKDGKG